MSSTTKDITASISPRRSFMIRTLAANFGRVAVTRRFEEVDLDRQVELAHEVGDEDEQPRSSPTTTSLSVPACNAAICRAQALDARRNRLRPISTSMS